MTDFWPNGYLDEFEKLLSQPVYALNQSDKERLLLPLLKGLELHHRAACADYQQIVDGEVDKYEALSSLPYLAVRLFKYLNLKSIGDEQIFKVLQSSGTTGQTPAKVYLDKETSARQSKVLVKIMQETLGKQRLPMLIIDSPAILKDKKLFSARGAGIQGLSFFGRDHTYALDENMQLNESEVNTFCERHQGQPVLVFGFTFMVWKYLIQPMRQNNTTFDLTDGILLHSGGWKKLESEKVDNQAFKAAVQNQLGIGDVYNFYGMAEQVGSIFVECEHGHLHCPVFADILCRDPYTLDLSPIGEQGLLQVLSSLPTSYPGHSLLTEDLGTILGIDDCPCGRKGKYFEVSGRLPKTEIRGCSDTHKEVSI